MTREEAIEYFKVYRKIFCEDHLKICPKDSIAYQATFKEKEFLDMAIKALEQKPCDDTVSREDAKSFLYERLNRLNNDELYDIFSVIIDDMYNELPSVQLKSGWIPVDDSLDAYIEKE